MNRMLAAALFGLTLIGAPVAAGAQTLSIGPSISTLGAGVEAGFRIGRWVGVRADFHGFPYETDRTIGDIAYNADATLSSFGATADLYLLFGLRVSAGLRMNNNEADIVGNVNRPVTIGGSVYNAAQVGRLEGGVDFDGTAPYLGIGYTGGLPFLGLDLVLDVGVLHQGAPRVSLRATGPVASLPGFAADLERERRRIEQDLDFLEWYPVVSVGLVYRFF